MALFNEDDTKMISEIFGFANRVLDEVNTPRTHRYGSEDEPITGTRVLTNTEAEKLRKALRDESWDDARHNLLHIGLTNAQVTCSQARCLVKTFSFEKGKAGTWLLKNDKIADRHNIGEMIRGLPSWDRSEILEAANA